MKSVIKQTNCDNCANKFKNYMAGMFTDKTYCEFSGKYICANCVHIIGEKDFDTSNADAKDATGDEVTKKKSAGFLT